MDLSFTDEQKILRKTVRDFARRELAPFSSRWDEENFFPHEQVKKLAELGIMGMVVPEKYGGCGSDYTTLAIAVEEIARVDGGVALTVASHNCLCTNHINLWANEKQRLKYLPDLASGKKLGAWALTEAGSGSDASSMRTTAVKKGHNWILNGSKLFITQGSVGGVYVVLASTTPSKKQHGISAFILEPGMRGFTVGKKEDKLGVRASDTAEIHFDNVEVPEENLIGEVDRGFIDTMKVLDRGRITIGAMAVGLGIGALTTAIKYAKERIQFGKPISEFEGVQWMISESYSELLAARLLVYKAAYLIDNNKNGSLNCAMGKLYASEAAMRAAYRAIQILGGYGYTKDYPAERFLRDAKLCEIGEGTSEVQRLVISRNL